jgi:hypothetical protein
VFADFPTDFDLNSLAYLMGMIEQGIIAPACLFQYILDASVM